MLDFDFRAPCIDTRAKAQSSVWRLPLLTSLGALTPLGTLVLLSTLPLLAACDGEQAATDGAAVEAGDAGDAAQESDDEIPPAGNGGAPGSAGGSPGPGPSPSVPRPVPPSATPATPAGSAPGQTPPAATPGVPTGQGGQATGGAGAPSEQGGNSGSAGGNGQGGSGNPGPSNGGSSGTGPSAGSGGGDVGGAETGGAETGGAGNGNSGAGGSAQGGSAQGGNGGSAQGGSGGSAQGGNGGGAPTGGAGGSTSEAGTDVFGTTELYGSLPNGAAWDSAHWLEEGPYSLSDLRDDNDPSGLSGMRGEGELEVEDGGELVMSGSEPRIYVYPEDGEEWLNVEVTVYYQRVSDEDTAWGGLVIGVRSGPDGHTTGTACDAHTYYSRLRNDGTADFEKELEHTPSSTRANTDLEELLPPDGEASPGDWIGWKYVSYNIPGEDALKLEAYIDLSEGENGGDWQLVNETIDDGGWFTDTNCSEYSPSNGESDFVWLDGGTVFIRNTNVNEARYRWVTIREITPP